MTTSIIPAHRVLVTAASTRTESINRALARRIAASLRTAGDDVALVELADTPLPIYDDETEQRIGIPAAAHRLAQQLAAAEVLVIVSPEYNGTFTPLLKNTIDWVTRVDTAVLAHLTVLIASASPGAGGGANGVSMVRTWMTNMGVWVAPRSLVVGSAGLTNDGEIAGVDDRDIERFVTQARPIRAAA